ncbi:MAG: carbamoyltransferase HypF [Flavobacterium sp.]|uniref:carbamoyltransferase HypF n=1 Tax=Flavobacterium sp. TaxID=239 RepID=UPI00260CBE2C|nr:carbamoyltransferase HypF [Flavobacterium sp.]MDD5149923.1 carbamoyltransferase HypF [Flavobacterium sp.]
MNPSTFEIVISGRVQGVGFRPFIFNLAKKLNIKGFVTNNELGVLINVAADENTIDDFYKQILLQKPQSSEITSSQINKISSSEIFDDFVIKPTAHNLLIDIPLTPDFAICESCSNEILDAENPRYYYPFTTCTQCGPRYTITKKFPFERINTSIDDFTMCGNCLQEYKNSNDIRFHSQTNSCPNCGITLKFTTNLGEILSEKNTEIFKIIAEKLTLGNIIALKNTAGYVLICDATNNEAVKELRTRKKRPTKPFAVLFKNTESIGKYLKIDDLESNLLNSTEAPIVILQLENASDLAINQISPNLETIGAMIPNSGTLKLVMENFGKPIIATSANFHGSPICSSEKEATKTLKEIADYFLHNSLNVLHPQDDSVMKFTEKNSQKIILRRSRGFAPNLLEFKTTERKEKILCFGSDLKNTITILPNSNCYVSEYIGDLSNYDTYLRFEKTIEEYTRIFSFEPEVVLFDAHPKYVSSRLAESIVHQENQIHYQKIQHHKAHFAAIIGEKKLWKTENKILGIIWDGIGFGDDKQIWGGEFFEYHNKEINRIGHLDYYPWVLGDKMSKNPKISALSISDSNPFFRDHFDDNEWNIYSKAIQNPTIQTSSMGRLFDAVGFVLGFHQPIYFEGEVAIYLEKIAQKEFSTSKKELIDYLENIEFSENIIPTKLLFDQIITAKINGISVGEIAKNFHYTLIKCIEKIASSNKIRTLAFSGGVFQNSLLVDMIIEFLSKDFELHFHENLSPNDENISFGQLNYYLNIKN